jgi:hypothetical protein
MPSMPERNIPKNTTINNHKKSQSKIIINKIFSGSKLFEFNIELDLIY